MHDALLELKFVEEEGFKKRERQQKIAELFNKYQNTPVIYIDPTELDESGRRQYYNIVEGPILAHVKKASSQLELTRSRLDKDLTRILILINVGYTALSPEEFKQICLKCVKNNSRKIDWLICGGIYFYSDTFDHYVIAPLVESVIDLSKPFSSLNALQQAWGVMLDKLMTESMLSEKVFDSEKMPVTDLTFDLADIRYVKPSPSMPKSDFWPSGIAPRENTSGIVNCPPVALTFPDLSESDWKQFKKSLPANYKGAYVAEQH